jgi:hypothetical protein
MTDTEPELTDEEQAATELLATLPAELVTDSLRAAVLHAAHGTSVQQKVTVATAEAEQAVRAALAAGDVPGAIEAATTLAAIARFHGYLPSVTVDPGAVEEAMTNAARHLREAESTILPLPIVHYTAQVNAWRSLPPNFQAASPHPLVAKPDLDAQGVVDELAKERERVTATTSAWYRDLSGPVNPLNHIKAASDIAGMCREHAAVTARTAAVVQKVNEARAEADLNWIAPKSVTSPAIKALAAL